MPAHRLARFILNVLLCSVGCVLLHTPSAIAQNAVELPQTDLTATDELAWRRGNMHTHSLWSDGDDYPEMIAAWYKERGYQFLVFTDHNTLLKQEQRKLREGDMVKVAQRRKRLELKRKIDIIEKEK